MKYRTYSILILILITIIALCGCQDSSLSGSTVPENSSFTEGDAESNSTVPIGENHPDHINTDYVYDIMGDTLVIKLDSNQTTGCSWTASDLLNLEETESYYTPEENTENMVGTGGVETHAFTATGTGTGSFRLIYGQQWEGGGTYEKYNVTMTIDEDLNISDVQFETEEVGEKENREDE